MKNIFLKSITIFMALMLIILISGLFPGNEVVKASNTDIVSYADVRIPAWYEKSEIITYDAHGWLSGDFQETVITDIQYNKLTKKMSLRVVPAQYNLKMSLNTDTMYYNTSTFINMFARMQLKHPNQDGYGYLSYELVKASYETVHSSNYRTIDAIIDASTGVINPIQMELDEPPTKLLWSAFFSKTFSDGYNWQGDKEFYGRRNFEIDLVPNSEPTLDILNSSNQFISGSSNFIPLVRVADPNGDQLEIKYYLDSDTEPREVKAVTNTTSGQTVSFNVLNTSNLYEGSHNIRFTASDGKVTTQNSVTIVVDKSPPVIGNINIISSDSQVQVSGTAADSISGLDNVPYRYTVGSQSSGWTTNPSFTATGLTSNTALYTKIEARDKVGNIAVHEQNVYTRAQVPSLSLQQNGETSLVMQLHDQNAASTQYLIQMGTAYVNSSGTLTSSPVWITPSGKTVVINGLTANTSYSFQVKARNNEGLETAFGGPATGTTLAAAPEGITAEASQQWIKLSWPPSAGALGYEVETGGAIINNGTSTSYTQNGLLPNTQHTYRVRIINPGGAGSWSKAFTQMTLPEPPASPLNLLTAPSQKFVSLTWDLVPHATRYEVEADGVVLDNGKLNSFTHKDLEASTEHTYRVRAGNAGGVSEWSAAAIQQTWPNPPETPTKISAVQDIHTVTVKWEEMERASGYEIEVDGLIIDNKQMTSYTHEGLEALSGHTYRIRAVNIGGKSKWSAPLDVTTHPEIPDVPTNIMTTADEGQITASWHNVPHTDSYDIEVDGGTIITVKDNLFVHDQLAADSKHTYRIRAANISGTSEWSKPVTMTTMPAGINTESLTNVVAVVTNKSITLSWDTVAANARYEIEVDGKILDNGADTIYNHTGLQAEEYHLYKIRVKQGTERGDWVAVLALSTLPNLPDSPSKIEGFAQNNSIELRWEKMEGASGYQLEVDGKTIDVGNNITYLHNELASGTAHTYRVRAKNTTGVTAWSPSLQKSTTSPDYVLKVKKDKEASLTLLAQNVQDFSELEFVVTYNPDELELIDLYDFTPASDLSNGRIAGSNLTATYAPGKITFSIDQNVVPGTSWSGEITTLTFKSKITSDSNVKVTVD
ncbi:fibronectin type III domain-containing protein [Paenibacillus sp. FSL R7-0302]|uniref:fibronectin type III domain-containing protein n=1 Tax=Paenibacillus sp. FSL R7-0302 TaxID=2921681 RepID=UPI0030F9ECE6